MEQLAALNDHKTVCENSSHLNESEGLRRSYVRRVLGFLRDIERVFGGTVVGDLIAEGEAALDGDDS